MEMSVVWLGVRASLKDCGSEDGGLSGGRGGGWKGN